MILIDNVSNITHSILERSRYLNLGKQIKENRKKLNLSQEDISKRLFVSRQTISNWENGRSYPDVQNLLLLGDLFDI